MKNSIILRQAKDVIRTDGWTYGIEGMNVEGPKCVLGALAKVAGLPPIGNATYDMAAAGKLPAAQALQHCLGLRHQHLWSWNDQLIRGSTFAAGQQKVLDALDECARREEEAGR